MDVILSFATMSENIAVDNFSRSIQRVIRDLYGAVKKPTCTCLPALHHPSDVGFSFDSLRRH